MNKKNKNKLMIVAMAAMGFASAPQDGFEFKPESRGPQSAPATEQANGSGTPEELENLPTALFNTGTSDVGLAPEKIESLRRRLAQALLDVVEDGSLAKLVGPAGSAGSSASNAPAEPADSDVESVQTEPEIDITVPLDNNQGLSISWPITNNGHEFTLGTPEYNEVTFRHNEGVTLVRQAL